MGSGGGSDDCDPWDLNCQAKKAVKSVGIDPEHPLAGLANIAANNLTGGTLGISKNGSPTKGAVIQGVDETIGELSGRNAARKAQMDAKDALDQEKQQRAQQLKEEQARKYQQDVNASNAAGAIRSSAAARTKDYLGTSSDPSKDFLGL